jgi:hypothetical protein
MHSTPVVLKGPRPWAFTKAELTAGIRRNFCDSRLVINVMRETSLKNTTPASGRIRGIEVVYKGTSGIGTLHMVLKEPHNSTPSGTAGAGKREAAFYSSLADSVPLQTPRLWSAGKAGNWLILDFIPSIREPEVWTGDDYMLAVEKLVNLHDRFWGLKEDMSVYPWLSRPLTSDKQIHLTAAETSLVKIKKGAAQYGLLKGGNFTAGLEKLVKAGKKIAAVLLSDTATLIHGDYWPGNLSIVSKNELAAFDWQQTGIAPGILDLVSLVQNSRWWFSPLPLKTGEIQEKYRTSLERCSGAAWTDQEWEKQWDYGLMWRFLMDWMPLLAEIPHPVFETRLPLLEEVWLDPIERTISNRL